MADDFKLERHEDEYDSEGPSGAGGADSVVDFLRGHLKLVLALVFSSLLGGAFAAWLLLPRAGGMQPQTVPTVAAGEELLSPARAQRIMDTRRAMREEFRSSHNEALTGRGEVIDMVELASRGELTLVSGLFQHYLHSTASFFELGRIITNNYVENRTQADQLFRSQVKPVFETAERRREVLRRRITNHPAVELYEGISYIAYHDSIAISHLEKFLEGGEVEEFTRAVEYANTAKLMLKDFWEDFRRNLREHRIDFEPPENLWRRYFISWDIVE